MVAKSKTLGKTRPQAAYFEKMSAAELLLFAYTAFECVTSSRLEDFSHHLHEKIRYRMPSNSSYPEALRFLTKWTNSGLLELYGDSGLFSFSDGLHQSFWNWVGGNADLAADDAELDTFFSADLPCTLDNMFVLLIMIDKGQARLNKAEELTKAARLKLLTSLSLPFKPEDKIYQPETYLDWLLSSLESLNLIHVGFSGRLELTSGSYHLLTSIQAPQILAQLCTDFMSTQPIGFFLMLPVLKHRSGWTEWMETAGCLLSDNYEVDNVYDLDECKFDIFEPLRWMGLLDWGPVEHDVSVRSTPLGRLVFSKLLSGATLPQDSTLKDILSEIYPMDGPDTLHIQPNFEVMATRGTTWNTRWQLSQFATLECQYPDYKYRFEKTSLLEGMKKGLTVDKVLDLLDKYSPREVPEEVRLTLEMWERSFGQAVILELTLLECATPKLAATIGNARKYQDYVLGFYSPTALIVRDSEKLRQLLEKQGIFLRPDWLDGEQVAEGQHHFTN